MDQEKEDPLVSVIFNKKEISLFEFIWAFMNVLEHDREEEIFITNALIEFYEHIKEHLKD